MSMWRNSVILLIAVIVTAMAVINVRYHVRTLTVQLEQAREQEQQLQIEWSTRQVQQVSAAKNDRIAEMVTSQGMERVDPSSTYYMKPKAAANATNAPSTTPNPPTQAAP